MIDKTMEPYYDIILSIFIGMICVLILHYLYDMPRIIVVKDENRIQKRCCGLNL